MSDRTLLFLLILSPLIYLTGGVEHVTPLSIANFLNLPSLSAINYLSYLLIIFCLIVVAAKDPGKIIPLLMLFVIMVSILFRESSVKDAMVSFVSQLLIISPLLLMIGCSLKIKHESLIKIINIYVLYVALCIILHYVFVSYYLLVGVSLPNERAVGIFKNPNHLAVFAIATLIIFYQLALQGVYTKKKVISVELLVAFVIYISGSRSAQLFFVMLIMFHSFFFNRRLFMLYVMLSIFGMILIISSDVGVEKIETLLTKREVHDIAEAGNMRMTILYEMLHNFSLSEMIFGKGSGEGSALFISNQVSNNEKVVWLDSNINTLTYTFGPLFTSLVVVILSCQIMYKAGFNIINMYRYLFVAYFMWFINIGEFFPIIFMLLLSTYKSQRIKNYDFNSHC
ncbi:O-antigen ligase family protein [Citrobacter sp. Ct235]|uniref:O-antigen ligase family protein n=1 Tax=Citrobacter sp. Ct235 TaxID=2985157 RepID=UPI0025760A79|nr:O-antigen ligase family protein [Citrobacter sp. Ct235]MDM2738342.1 O-antigen ligase family protein [Citrobacter sp. Ct235]